LSTHLTCITNEIPDVRACTVKGEHVESCDGWEYRLTTSDTGRQTTHGQFATGRPCIGCLPRRASKGFLCWPCWERLEHALAEWPRWSSMISGVDRLVQRDNAGVRTRSGGHIPLPGKTLAYNECCSYLLSRVDSTEMWVSTKLGALDAVQFTRAARAAYRAHPVEEQPRKVQRVRCPDCGQLSFIRRPPAYELAPVTVTCQNDACGRVIREGDMSVGYQATGDPEAPWERTETEALVVVAGIEKGVKA